MPEVTTTTTADKTPCPSVGMDSTAAWGAPDAHPTTADVHPAADVHPSADVHPAAPAMAAPATVAAATTVRSEYRSGQEQARGNCGDQSRVT
jgi:hypothetical protein